MENAVKAVAVPWPELISVRLFGNEEEAGSSPTGVPGFPCAPDKKSWSKCGRGGGGLAAPAEPCGQKPGLGAGPGPPGSCPLCGLGEAARGL